MSFSASFDGTDVRLVAQLKAKGPVILKGLIGAMDASTLGLQSHIILSKLEGQVLHHRSGKLISSVRAIPAVVEGTGIVGRVEAAGGPAFYGAVHEYGGIAPYEIVPVRKKALHWIQDGADIFRRRVMHPPLPKRPFMAPSLEEMSGDIINRLQLAVNEALK